MFFGAIADDFTGASDLACLLARSGAAVALRIGVPDTPADRDSGVDFEVIALKIRTETTEQAVAEAREALAWLRAGGAQRFFWKYCSTFDSTAEGNIGPVAEALMADLGAAQTIFCPAFPENGRSIYMGHLFVGEQPLDESPMRDHPLTPMRDSSLLRLLAPQVRGAVGLAKRLVVAEGADALRSRLELLRDEGIAHVVVDAVADSDLGTIAEACCDLPLLTGGSAVAMPLPEIYRQRGYLQNLVQPGSRPNLDRGQIVLSGSCSAMTRKQVAAYVPGAAAFRLDPLLLARDGSAALLSWLEQQPPEAAKILYATAEPEEVRRTQETLGVAAAGALVEAALAEAARKALDLGVRRFVIAGGETSGAVVKALDVDRLTIGPEIAPGVPWTYALSHGQEVALALKSGNFGQEGFFAEAFSRLDEGLDGT
ncbi:MAG: four-carbon acid sugar kinase family protein [Kiloniellales bacterium]